VRNLTGTARDFDSLAETRACLRTAKQGAHVLGKAQRESRGTRVSRLASGRQANLTGAHGDVPSPPDTFSQACPSAGCLCSPRTRSRSIPQLVTSAP